MPRKSQVKSGMDLTLTQEEKDAKSFLDWPDTTLARAVRETARLIKASDDDKEALYVTGCLVILASVMKRANAETLNLESSFNGNLQGYELKVSMKLKKVAA
jgi:hypothetical protein